MPAPGKTRDLHWIIVCLVILAILLSTIAAWRRFSQRERSEDAPLLQKESLGLQTRDFVPGLMAAKDWLRVGGAPAGPPPAPRCRFICGWCGRTCWSDWNGSPPLCPSCRRRMAPQEFGTVAAPGSSPARQARPVGGSQTRTHGAPPIQEGALAPHGSRGSCSNCHKIVAAPRPAPAVAVPVAMTQARLPTPRQQDAAKKEFIEGHWLGLEVIPLTAELVKEYRIPKGEQGLLVDEVTLEAAESGILAGDMVHSINGHPTPNLKEFLLATQRVKNLREAQVEVGRRGTAMMFVMQARNTQELGIAQMEAAQPIQPGAISPHRLRGKPCTACHIIMRSGGQLPTDAGDILPSPPPIARNARPPHSYRGPCNSCHQIMR